MVRSTNATANQDEDGAVPAPPRACVVESEAVEFLERMRWGEHPRCPRCGHSTVYRMSNAEAAADRSGRFLWRCRGCKRQHTVRIGTLLEDSRIPLRHWCFVLWAASSSEIGVDAREITRATGLSYKSALFLMDRIGFAFDCARDAVPTATRRPGPKALRLSIRCDWEDAVSKALGIQRPPRGWQEHRDTNATFTPSSRAAPFRHQ